MLWVKFFFILISTEKCVFFLNIFFCSFEHFLFRTDRVRALGHAINSVCSILGFFLMLLVLNSVRKVIIIDLHFDFKLGVLTTSFDVVIELLLANSSEKSQSFTLSLSYFDEKATSFLVNNYCLVWKLIINFINKTLQKHQYKYVHVSCVFCSDRFLDWQ